MSSFLNPADLKASTPVSTPAYDGINAEHSRIFSCHDELLLGVFFWNLAFRFDGQFARDFAVARHFRRLGFDGLLLLF